MVLVSPPQIPLDPPFSKWEAASRQTMCRTILCFVVKELPLTCVDTHAGWAGVFNFVAGSSQKAINSAVLSGADRLVGALHLGVPRDHGPIRFSRLRIPECHDTKARVRIQNP